MKTLVLTLAVLLNSCSSNDNFQRQTMETTLIGKGNLTGNGAENIPRQRIVIYNRQDWTALINNMNAANNVTAGFTETNIDFNTFQVIAVFEEIKRNGGHSIDITNVVENESNIAVTVENLLTGGVTSVITQPYHIVKIPKSKKPVLFQ